ncbi:MAG: hypothetical protein BM563_00205 [Bacteroidetes bacterium MedPE-SWsnd-G1]|nr:MAG: hypothetical protein BM563_00205 [Bacteroidetes bacterium MedPE-SWsnd-G1]
MKKFSILLAATVVLLLSNSCKSESSSIDQLSFKEQLMVLFPNAVIDSLGAKDHFSERYELTIQQPLDHSKPENGTFEHHVFISHAGYEQPNLLITTGYAARNNTYELSKAFHMNQVLVEYRFYGKSRPDSIPWNYLTNDNALADYHALSTQLKKIYKNKWMSTGISKGGENVMMYKAKYPDDMDVGVPYVAPLINTREDMRTINHINMLGADICDISLFDTQRMILERKEEILPVLADYMKEKKYEFTELSLEEALEYAVLEYPFSFLQWGGKCEEIPTKESNALAVVTHINNVVGFWVYSDAGIDNALPSFYQHMIELGYYGFELEPLKDLLSVVKSSSNLRFAPKGVEMNYNSDYIKEVREYIETKGDKLVYVYGEMDPWYACAPNPKKEVDALKMVLKGGSHATRIKDFSEEDQNKIYKQIQEWLGGAKLYLNE